MQYAHLFGVLRENALGAHDITNSGHYEKSLCSDNDPCCHSHKIKIISSDWIGLLCRLLKRSDVSFSKFGEDHTLILTLEDLSFGDCKNYICPCSVL